ncbi:MAG: hypothetical protein BWY99_02861 [Synergistetes bacterium ADurb.BinA166]|nr:MAG: hypothetical protein BWY99_02861 [Synergistetes bacterium ADurb.BinA166]
MPGSTMPGVKSSMLSTPSTKANGSKLSRTSLPGRSSSRTMSFRVGRPTSADTYLWTSSLPLSSGLTSRSATEQPRSPAILSTRAYLSGWTADASRGSTPPLIRRKPAACSKVFRPSRGTSRSSLREEKAPCSARCRTIRSATEAPSPDTCDRSSGLAVFRSTPTALTQDPTTAASAPFSSFWSTSCWYCPTPMDLGSILISSDSGSSSLRPMDTAPRTVMSRSGNSLRATSEAE